MNWLIKLSDARPITVRVIDADAAPVAGLTLTSSWKWTKSGGAIGNAAGTLTDRTLGVYEYTPTAGEVDTLGNAILSFADTTNGYISVGGSVQVIAVDPRDATAFGISRIDATISSRSTYAGADTSGTTTLLSRITSTRAGYLDNIGGGSVALQSQIPANFSTVTISSGQALGSSTFAAGDNVNVESFTAGAITAASIAANALNGKGDWLLASSYTAAPTASANASAVRTELSTELARIDATISSRATPAQILTNTANTLLTNTAGYVTTTDGGTVAVSSFTSTAATQVNAIETNTTTLLARIGAFTGSGVNTILGFLKAIMSKTAGTPSDVGGTFDASTDSTEAIRDRGDAAWVAATFNGANAVTINVKYLTTNISGATVTITQGIIVDTKTTDASGNASFSLNAGDYTLAIVKSGYSFTPETISISGAGTLNKTLTANSLTPSVDPARKTIRIITKDGNGATQANKTFYWKLTAPPADDGFAYDYSVHSATTNGSGEFTDQWLIGGKYEYWRDQTTKTRRNVTITADTDELPEV